MRFDTIFYIFVLFLVFLSAISLVWERIFVLREKAIVVEVIDGDTIKLETNETVRLLGINAPERGERYYNIAKKRLEEMVLNKTVLLEADVVNKDRYGRLLRYVFLNNTNVNVEMVKSGCAKAYIEEPNTRYEEKLRAAESYAFNRKIGMWALSKSDVCEGCLRVLYFHWDAEENDCENPNDEYVIFTNECRHGCNLTGWRVEDEGRHVFIFPPLVLRPGKNLTLFSGCGKNNSSSLYWCALGSCPAVWNNHGDTLYLKNPRGEAVLRYSFP